MALLNTEEVVMLSVVLNTPLSQMCQGGSGGWLGNNSSCEGVEGKGLGREHYSQPYQATLNAQDKTFR